ncbi:Uncharacterised protein [Enterobacter cloacae]|nr:Uncharacterised protein [Enterobacter cloacae]
MHYTSMINPLALLSCDSPASAKIIVDYVKTQLNGKRAARTVLTGMCYSVGSATRQGSSSLTRFIGQSAMTLRT